MATNALVQTRIDVAVKERAAEVLRRQGMTVSEAVRILLTRTATEGAAPFTPANDAAYDAWFRAKVQQAIDDPRPLVTNQEAKRRWAKRRAELAAKTKADI